ncbi:DDE-type integrase/transposase/recombinase [Geodermatophilus sabuli]|uniref:DDE-type integrase/transposase/recombinase n=1 Tax=Geodermatophilus sabuli TaxID=1564158 RepID=UPI0035D49BB9
MCLACVTDVFSRMVIGWSMASHRKTDLVVDAVTMAVHRRGGHVPGVIRHGDRGGSTAPTSSSGSCAATARWPAWAASRTAATTPWPKACSLRSSASCSTLCRHPDGD